MNLSSHLLGQFRLVLVATALAAVQLGAGCSPPYQQAKACDEVIQQYFGDRKLADANGDFSSFGDLENAPDAENEIRQAYGVDGSCWRTTPEVAEECERRCRAFLTGDCFEGFGPEDSVFAPTACNFPERCGGDLTCTYGQECNETTGCCAAEPPGTAANPNATCDDYAP